MILSKKEFTKMFELSENYVYHLTKKGEIILNDDGKIDTEKNKKFIEARKRKLKITSKNKPEKNEIHETTVDKKKLKYERDILNSKLDERIARSELLYLKLEKEKGNIIEVSVLRKVLSLCFENFFKFLTEIPPVYAMEIVNIVHSVENPKEIVCEFLTNKINEAIKLALDGEKQAEKEFFGV